MSDRGAPPDDPAQERDPDDRVLRQRMRVAAQRDGWVLLEADRASACGACAARPGCGAGALTEALGGGPARLVAPQDRAAPVGEEVEVAMSGAMFLRLSALAYLLPPASLAALAALAAATGLSDATLALLCLPTLALSLTPLWLAERGGGAGRALRIERTPPQDAAAPDPTTPALGEQRHAP